MGENTQRGRDDAFFERARTVAATGNTEYSIEMYLQGLNIAPDLVAIHRKLRQVCLQRTSSGGKSLGMYEVMKLQAVRRGPIDRMLAREKLLCYEPGNVDYMIAFCEAAHDAGAFATEKWVRELIEKVKEST
ncbi:hypothetical protein BH09PLA1_BH09PLA1_35010 [soil metagenome]